MKDKKTISVSGQLYARMRAESERLGIPLRELVERATIDCVDPARMVAQPAVRKPAATTKPAVRKPAVTKPAVTKPAATKTTATKPAPAPIAPPPRITASSCAICGRASTDLRARPLGKNDALVAVCAMCDDEPAETRDGTWRGYEPTGGLLNTQDVDRGLGRVLGDRPDTLAEIDSRVGRTPSPALSEGARMDVAWRTETIQRARTGAVRFPRTSSLRQRKR